MLRRRQPAIRTGFNFLGHKLNLKRLYKTTSFIKAKKRTKILLKLVASADAAVPAQAILFLRPELLDNAENERIIFALNRIRKQLEGNVPLCR